MSRTIDERVVEMRFDNKQFESGVKQSMSTLEKLKTALNFSDSEKSLNGLNAAAKNVSLDGIAAGVESLQKRFSTLGIIGMRAIENITDSVMGTLAKGINFINDAIVSGGIRRAMNLENAHFQLQSIIGDEERVQEVMNAASKSVDGTAYSFDVAAKAASQMTASGVTDVDDLSLALRGLAGTTATFSADYEQMSMIFTQVAGQGRLMGDQLLQLSTRGANAAVTIANFVNAVNKGDVEVSDTVKRSVRNISEATNVTEADIRDLVSKGKVDFNAFAGAMNYAFGDSAEKANETFTGAMSNIKAAFARIGEGFVAPLVAQNSAVVELFNSIRMKVNDVKSALVFNEELGNVNALSKQFTDAMLKMAKGASDFIKGFDISTPMAVFYNLVESVKNVVKGLWSVLKPVGKAFAEVFLSFDGDAVIEFTAAIEKLTSKLILTENGSKQLHDALKGVFDVIRVVIDTIAGLISAFTGLQIPLDFTGEGFFNLIGYLGRCLSEMTLWLRTSPQMVSVFNAIQKAIGYVNDVIGYAISGFKMLWNQIVALKIPEGIMEGLMKLFEKIGTVLTPYISEAIKNLKEFKNNLETFVPEKFEIFLDAISQFFKDLKSTITGLDLSPITGMFDKLKDVLKQLMDVIKTNEGFMTFITNAKDFALNLKEAFTFNKVLDNLSDLMTFINKFATWIKESVMPLFGDFSLGGAVAGAAGVGMVYSLIKVAKAFEKLAGTIQKIPDLFTSLGGALKAWQNELKAQTLKQIATALLILVAALVVLSFADLGKVMQASVALSLIAGTLLSGLSTLLNVAKRTKTIDDVLFQFGKAVKYKALASAIKEFAVSLAIVVGAIVAIAILYKKDSESMNEALKIIGIISVAMIGIIAGMSILGDMLDNGMKNFAKAAFGVLALSAALSVVVSALAKLFKLEIPSDVNTKLNILITIFGILALLVVAVGGASALAGGNSIKSGPILALTAMLYVTVLALQKLFKLELPSDWGVKVGILAGIFVALGALMLVVGEANRIAGGSIKAMGSILAMCVFIGTVVAALMVLQLVPGLGLLKGVTALGTVLLALGAALLGASKITDEKTYKSVLAMSVAVGAITAALGILSIVPLPLLAKSATALGAMLLALALDFLAISKINNDEAFKNVLAMVSMVVIIATSLYVLSEQPWEALLSAGVSMSAVMASLSLAFKTISNAEGIDIKKISLFLAATLAVIPIGAALYILAEQPWAGMLASGAALSGTILAFTLAYKVISSANGINLEKIALFLAASLAVIPIGLALSELAKYSWESLLGAAGALSLTLAAFSACFLLISKAKPDMVGIAAFLAGTAGVALIAYSIYELSQQPWQQLLTAAGVIAIVLTAMGVAMAICSAVGAAAPAAIAGLVALDLFVANFTLVLLALGKIFEDPTLKNLLSGGVSILADLGNAIGSFVGNIVSGFLGTFSSSLPKIGDDLSSFMSKADPFFEGAKKIDEGAMRGIKSLAEAILVLTKTSIFQGLSSWLTGGSSLVKFGEDLEDFGPHFAKYYQSVRGVDAGVVEASANAAKALAEMAKTLPNSGGLAAKIFGDNNLSSFGKELESFGPHIAAYANNVRGLDPAAVEASANAAKVMAEMAKTLPNSGGLAAKIFGDNTLSAFGKELESFGPHIAAYANHVRGMDAGVVEASANAAKALSELATDLPNSGGLISLFTGDNDIGNFGSSLESFGKSLRAYYNQISSIDIAKLDAVILEVNKLKNMAIGLNGIDASGMTNFSSNLEKMGKKGIDAFLTAFDNAKSKATDVVSKFINNVNISLSDGTKKISTTATELGKSICTSIQKGIQNVQPATISMVKKLATDIITTLRSSLPSSTFTSMAQTNVMQSFINGLSSKRALLLTTIKNICTSLISTMRSSLPSSTFTSMAQTNVMQSFINGLSSKRASLIQTVTSICNSVVQTFKSILTGKTFNDLGKSMVQALASGIESNKSSATKAAKSVGKDVVSALKSSMSESSFRKIGENAALGLKKGIESKVGEIRDAAIAAAKKAIDAAKKALEEKSPSRAFFRLGAYASEGLALGMTENLKQIDVAGAATGERALDSFTKTIGAISDAISFGDIDTDITVTPKIDLSNAKSGIAKLTEMFNRDFEISTSVRMANDAESMTQRAVTAKEELSKLNTKPQENIINNTYNLEQNNYSPKALSRSEIYRDTRNLFSDLKSGA